MNSANARQKRPTNQQTRKKHDCLTASARTRETKLVSALDTNTARMINKRAVYWYLRAVYHFTASFKILPSIASSEVKVSTLYCTQSIISGSVPLLRTERLPAGATRTTLPSEMGNTLPST